METITSAHNPLLKRIRRLLDAPRERRKEGMAVLDGAHLLGAYATRFSLTGATVLLPTETSSEVRDLLERFPPDRVIGVSDQVFRAVSTLETPSAVLALVAIPRMHSVPATSEFWIVLDGVQDPGNVGSILRTAAASGATRAILSPTCADPWSPKSLRGGMGAQFIVPVQDHADLFSTLENFKGTVYAADAGGSHPLYDADLTGNTAILLGGEGSGLGQELLRQADATLRIPITEGVESLNVAAAAAMICGERIRQQHARRG